MSAQQYIGNELELFENAKNWKNYWGKFVKPYLKGRVLEAGAGLGGTTKFLCDGTQQEWLCLEPDEQLFAKTSELIRQQSLPRICRAVCGTLADLPENEVFDCIIYIDVVEHIENDREELLNAQKHLAEGGFLIILVPAHNFLYSPFDKAIGHFRRYNKKMLSEVAPADMKKIRLHYLDFVGLSASLANKLLLSRSYPTLQQILFWDKVMVPVSVILDSLTGFRFGKSVLGIWQKKQ
jgi:SAM-dependent methyltransferase